MAAGKHQAHSTAVDRRNILLIVGIVAAAAAIIALIVLAAVFIFGGEKEQTPTPPPPVIIDPDLTPGEGDEPTPPDDGGDEPTPPDDGGDEQTPPDEGGDEQDPPDDGGDEQDPPDDGGDEPPEPAYRNPLTGLGMDTDVSEYRPYAVMLNNLKKATPQVGITEADMIFEIPVEGGITRLMGLYQGFKGAEVIGSVRSARPYYVDIAMGFDAIYIHAGGSDDAYARLKSTGITHIDGVNGSGETFFRDQTRAETMGKEHSLMLDVPTVEAYLKKHDARLTHKEGFSAGFTFADEVERAGASAVSVEVKFSKSKSTFFAYDPETKLYAVSQYDAPMTDGATDGQLKVRNIITISARITPISGDTEGRLKATLTGSGKGKLIADGVVTQINWMRKSDTSQFIFTDENGDEIVLSSGVTYIAILPISSGSVDVK